MTRSSQNRTNYPDNLEIMATSPRGSYFPATAVTANASGRDQREEALRLSRYVTVRGDCYDILDLYQNCIQQRQTDTPLCHAAVKSYLQCSESEK